MRKWHKIPVLFLFVAIIASLVVSQTKPKIKTGGKEEDGLVLIPGGEFVMGTGGEGDNSPEHKVRIDPFYIDKYEVTNARYYKFCEETGRDLPEFWGMEKFHCGLEYPDHPVVGVSWYDASAYAEWAGKRLPSEAEWEYAARGSLPGKKFPNGNKLDKDAANFKSDGTAPVGSYPPNQYGLHDMAGNVVEWVNDFYDKDYYKVSPHDNPKGPEEGKFHVIRGGGWHSGKSCVTVDRRNCLIPGWVDFNVGFRCAKDFK